MSVNIARILYRICSGPAWKLLLIVAVLAFAVCFLIKGKKKRIPIVICVVSVLLYFASQGLSHGMNQLIMLQSGQEPVRISRDAPGFSEKTMFSLRIYQPWIYESLHYTLENDGTLIVQYFNTELGREKLSDEKMKKIRKVFSPKKVYSMDVGIENDRTDGTRRYIVLYDADGNEIEIGGYELEGGDNFNRYFYELYDLVQDDYTKQWSDKLDECKRDGTTYGERYLKQN